MTHPSAIIHAHTIDGNGYGRPLKDDEVSKEIKDHKLAWVHLNAITPHTREWLQREVDYLDQIILDALLAEETRPRIMEFEQGALIILRGMNLNENAEPEDMISIRMWIDPSRIISIQRRKLKAVGDIVERLTAGTGPKDSGEFIAALSARLFDRMEPVLTELDERTDRIEETVMEDPQISERQEIIDIRKEAIIYRRYIAPQRDVISALRLSELPWLTTMHKRHLQENLDRVLRYIEDLDAIRERAQIIKDELRTLFQTVSTKTCTSSRSSPPFSCLWAF